MKKVFFVILTLVIGLSIETVNAEESMIKNSNIVGVYQYNPTSSDSNYCITGEETTCKEIDNLDNLTSGTIVKYKVNDTETYYFYVVHDDGTTLTLQQRETTIRNIAWYADSSDTSKGPITVLPVLEEKTATWTNVNDITYEAGKTVFKTNYFTGCSTYTSCETNAYTLSSRTAKARMITLQEAIDLGCNIGSETCPIWMHNYMYNSTFHSGTVDDNEKDATTGGYNDGYWTMSAYTDNASALAVIANGSVDRYNTSAISNGVRAVVVIDKYAPNNTSSTTEITESNNDSNDDQVVQVENTALNTAKIGISIGLAILVLGIMVIIQTVLKEKKKKSIVT